MSFNDLAEVCQNIDGDYVYDLLVDLNYPSEMANLFKCKFI